MNKNNAAKKPWRLIQVSDPHLGATRDYRLAGIETYETFRQVLAEVASGGAQPDMIYATGDIASSGAQEAYRLFGEQMQFLEIPYGWLPGNHDDLAIMQENLSSVSYWPLLELGSWRVVSLNTAVPGEVGGKLAESELTFLEQVLNAEPYNPFVLFMHHPVLPVGCDWLDKQRVANADDLQKIVNSAGNVHSVFSGHVHQEFVGRWAGCDIYTSPSTCFQFAANSRNFSLSDQAPGYRWIDLQPSGCLETGVVYLNGIEHSVDHKVVSY